MPGQKASEAERRAQILRAAYDVAFRDGLDAVTVRIVAAEAGLSQHLKDVKLILASGDKAGARLPLSHVHSELLTELENAGFGAEDRADQRSQQAVLVLRAWPRQSLRKWTVQRCHGHPSTCASAAFIPRCASLIASRTPTRPRATRFLRNSRQNASVSASPTSDLPPS